jgi:hypothetical protein
MMYQRVHVILLKPIYRKKTRLNQHQFCLAAIAMRYHLIPFRTQK